MSYLNLLILQFISYLLAEFIFQPDKWMNDKDVRGFRSVYLYYYLVMVFLLSWILSFQLNFILAALVITIFYFVIDGLQKYLSSLTMFKGKAFFIGQVLRIITIIFSVSVFCNYIPINPIVKINVDTKVLLIIAAYLFCLKPTNILIKEILNIYEIKIDKDNSDIPNAGKLIGLVERILTLTLILLDQYEAVGFIIAAKSILRFKESETTKTEYLLVGTLLSFGIAVITGILIQFYK